MTRPNERTVTAGFARFFGPHRDLLVGIGDDAAVVRQRHDRAVLCCDPVVQGVHFDDDAPLQWVGRKVVNRNLADLAAMGAVADWLMLSVVVPRRMSWTELRPLMLGVRKAARAAAAIVVGGDLCVSDGPLVATISAHGHLPGRALTRSGVRVGDTLHVSGPLGGSRLGHHLRFRPPLAEGLWLAQQPDVRAAMDVSDGLLLDLETMLISSSGSGPSDQRGSEIGNRLGAEIDGASVPIRAAARTLAGGDRERSLHHALNDGEDHVLLWSQRAGATLAAGGPLAARARRPIGRVVDRPGLWLCHDGRQTPVGADAGFQHRFAGEHE
ncbi:MAG: thiamine-monophosphate kinase [Planctomycetota bacterium]